jgi:hypothetical protein
MKMKPFAFLPVLIMIMVSNHTIAQDSIPVKSFIPGGKPFVKIFSNFHTDTEAKNTAFEVTRAYFGYGYELGPQFSSKLTLDVGSPEIKLDDSTSTNTSLHLTAYLKTASLDYKTEKLEANFGLIGLKQHKLTEKYWGVPIYL